MNNALSDILDCSGYGSASVASTRKAFLLPLLLFPVIAGFTADHGEKNVQVSNLKFISCHRMCDGSMPPTIILDFVTGARLALIPQ